MENSIQEVYYCVYTEKVAKTRRVFHDSVAIYGSHRDLLEPTVMREHMFLLCIRQPSQTELSLDITCSRTDNYEFMTFNHCFLHFSFLIYFL
jgi:predicted glutamine amidotransferase